MKSKLEVRDWLIAAPILIGVSFYHAWAEWLLWGWFAVPMGLPSLGYWHIYGVSILIARFVSKVPTGEQASTGQVLAWLFLSPIVAVAFGWAAKGLAGL